MEKYISTKLHTSRKGSISRSTVNRNLTSDVTEESVPVESQTTATDVIGIM